MSNSIPTFRHIEQAYMLIQSHIHKTPVLKSDLLNTQFGCEMFFKCENFQKSGAFKYRGATHAILCLSNAEKQKGVVTHSSGNHAGALSKAAAINGVKAYIVMPHTAPMVKVEAVKSYGGIITFCEPTLQAREDTLMKVQSETGAVMIHPFDNFKVICGQGTVALELASQINQPDVVLAPVGGGGLLSGTAITVKNIFKGTRVIAAEPLNASDAFQSFNSNTRMPPLPPNTIADGLLTALSVRTFKIMMENVDDVLTASESTIVEAMKLIYQYLKIVIEPSGAVPLAVIMEHAEKFRGKKVALIISGGNVDLNALPF